jgi:hypothetical protein
MRANMGAASQAPSYRSDMASEEWLKGRRYTQQETTARVREAAVQVHMANQKANSYVKLLESVIRSIAIERSLRIDPENARLFAKRRHIRHEIKEAAQRAGFDREEFMRRLISNLPEAGQPDQLEFLCDVLGIH